MEDEILTLDKISEWTQKHGHPPRILIFTESPDGFGHFNIVNEVAQKIQALGGQVGVASGTLWHGKAAFNFTGATQYNLPPVLYNGEGIGINPFNGKAYSEDIHYQNERAKAVVKAAKEFKLDIVVQELYPFMMSYRDTDLSALKGEYRGHPPSPGFVCLCRDIIHGDSAKSIAHTQETLNQDFDQVLVRGDGILNRLEDCQPEWASIKPPVTYTGNIVRSLPPVDVMPDKERLVLVGFGGGWGKPDKAFFERAIEARQYSKIFWQNPWKIMISNNCPEEIFNELKTKAAQEAPDGHITITRPYNSVEVSKDIANCAAAIVHGGYNITSELVSCGHPFVVVPMHKGANKEQLMRAEILDAHGLARNFSQDKLSGTTDATGYDKEQAARKLADTLDMSKTNTVISSDKPNYNGAEQMSKKLVKLACQQREKNTPGTKITESTATLVLPETEQFVR